MGICFAQSRHDTSQGIIRELSLSQSDAVTRTTLSSAAVVARLLRLAWGYRGWCLAMLVLQAILMALAVSLVQLGGLSIDVIRSHSGGEVRCPICRWACRFPLRGRR